MDCNISIVVYCFIRSPLHSFPSKISTTGYLHHLASLRAYYATGCCGLPSVYLFLILFVKEKGRLSDVHGSFDITYIEREGRGRDPFKFIQVT